MPTPRPLTAAPGNVTSCQERGVALVMALVLLVIMNLLGLSAMRSAILEEKMAGQIRDRNLSLEAAEAALRQAEAHVAVNRPIKSPGEACDTAGVCGLPAPGAPQRWSDPAFTGWVNAATVSSGALTITPQMFTEYLGNTFPCVPTDLSRQNNCPRYRITARSQAGGDRASVTLQSVYATEGPTPAPPTKAQGVSGPTADMLRTTDSGSHRLGTGAFEEPIGGVDGNPGNPWLPARLSWRELVPD